MESIIGLKDLRQKMSEYAKKVKAGKSFIVVRRSKPLFKIIPISEDEIWEPVVNFTKIKKGGIDIDDLLSRL
ncbi:type II toxin-antitoxin system prevent-host-death family antitoxin [Patescibacteria group bacterium]|nr:type II toxin-antitoxin system prevent-host-death family antitoxin [Patescibacteria group bacterium]